MPPSFRDSSKNSGKTSQSRLGRCVKVQVLSTFVEMDVTYPHRRIDTMSQRRGMFLSGATVLPGVLCGRRSGLIAEADLDTDPSFDNPYEESKFQAEQLLRRTPGIRATIYRPSVIVGDSRTGYTSTFTGLYRFLELGVRLAA